MSTTKRIEENHLDYVRRRLGETPASGYARIAADAGLSIRTLQNIIEASRDVYYGTVMKLYKVLAKAEKKARQ